MSIDDHHDHLFGRHSGTPISVCAMCTIEKQIDKLRAEVKEMNVELTRRAQSEHVLREVNAQQGDSIRNRIAERDEARALAKTLEADGLKLVAERNEARATAELHQKALEKAQAALTKINAIRNSIIGGQCFNWSEHAYPLVAALNAAGIEGMDYPAARENFATMLERSGELAAQRDALAAEAVMLRDILKRRGCEEAVSGGDLGCTIETPTDLCPTCAALATPSRAAEWLGEHDAKVRAENEGPGTPAARWEFLLDELERRFPDPSPNSSEPPEFRYLQAIDAHEEKVRREQETVDREAFCLFLDGSGVDAKTALAEHDDRVRRETLEEAAKVVDRDVLIRYFNEHPNAPFDDDTGEAAQQWIGEVCSLVAETWGARIRALAPRAPETAPAKSKEFDLPPHQFDSHRVCCPFDANAPIHVWPAAKPSEPCATCGGGGQTDSPFSSNGIAPCPDCGGSGVR